MNRWSWSDLGSRPLLFPALTFALGAWVGVRTGPIFGKFLVVSAALLALSALWGRRTGAHLLLLAGLFSAGASLSLLAARVEVPGGSLAGEVRLEGRVAREATSDGTDGARARGGPRRRAAGRVPGAARGREVGPRGSAREPGSSCGGSCAASKAPRTRARPIGRRPEPRRGLLYSGGFTRGSLVVRSEPAPGARWLDAGPPGARREGPRALPHPRCRGALPHPRRRAPGRARSPARGGLLEERPRPPAQRERAARRGARVRGAQAAPGARGEVAGRARAAPRPAAGSPGPRRFRSSGPTSPSPGTRPRRSARRS